ncbi:MAG: hypothetical protein WBQ25_23385 [Nitrososphaeraceae archaeon]
MVLEYIWLWLAIENDNREILQISRSKERNMFLAERFILNLVKNMGEHLDRLGEFDNDFEKFLKTKAKSKSYAEDDRMYKDVLDSRFELTKVIRIENMDYKDSISGKGADFTSKSIRDLIALGYSDALKSLTI